MNDPFELNERMATLCMCNVLALIDQILGETTHAVCLKWVACNLIATQVHQNICSVDGNDCFVNLKLSWV